MDKGVIGYCGMVEVFINYRTSEESLGSQIIDQFTVYFWLKLSLLTVADSRKARVIPALGLRLKSCFLTRVDTMN